jgi:Domain of unknown function (DUF397)
VLNEEIIVSAPDLVNTAWCKSSRSNGDGNVCVEVAFLPEATAVRDSKNPTGGVLILPTTAWGMFRLVALAGSAPA